MVGIRSYGLHKNCKLWRGGEKRQFEKGDIQYFGHRFRSDLLSEGKVQVTIQELFNERDSIPVFLLEEYDELINEDEDVEDEIDKDEIKLI